MKAISIKQPWAWLIANGIKDVENRSWQTKYRGKILIHAGKQIDRDGLEYMSIIMPKKHYENEKQIISTTGGIVGIADLANCVQNSYSIWAEPEVYHWVIENAKPVKFIPYKGRLGLFDVDIDEKDLVIL